MYGFGENKLKTSPGYLSWIIADSSSNNRGLRFRKDLTSKSALVKAIAGVGMLLTRHIVLGPPL